MSADPPIAFYVHHVGRGHAHRATAVAHALARPVVGLSSLPRPADWPGDWIRLPRDDDGGARPDDPTAGGRLHWAPLGHPGLRARTAAMAREFAARAPSALVCDVSVEAALLARLHGIPVIGLVQPGDRGDAAHLLGYDVASALIGCWPPTATGMVRGVPAGVAARVEPVGALSRLPLGGVAAPEARHVVAMWGAGGDEVGHAQLAAARAETPGWTWTVRGGGHSWDDDPRALIAAADVVVTHAGQNMLAEVAAARRPAVVLPQRRPHREQVRAAEVLAAGDWPVEVLWSWPECGWPGVLAGAAELDPGGWASWCDGRAAERFAAVVERVACGATPVVPSPRAAS